MGVQPAVTEEELGEQGQRIGLRDFRAVGSQPLLQLLPVRLQLLHSPPPSWEPTSQGLHASR